MLINCGFNSSILKKNLVKLKVSISQTGVPLQYSVRKKTALWMMFSWGILPKGGSWKKKFTKKRYHRKFLPKGGGICWSGGERVAESIINKVHPFENLKKKLQILWKVKKKINKYIWDMTMAGLAA